MVLPVPIRAGFWMGCAALGFALMVSIVRHLSSDMDVLVVTFWRNTLGLLVFVPWMVRRGWRGLRTTRPGLYVVRGAIMVVSSATLFLAVALMPVAEVTALTFTAPLFVTVLAIIVLGERVDGPRWAAIAIGFAGVVVILRPGAAVFDWAALVALFSTFAFACIIITGKMLARTERPEQIGVYLWLISSPLTLLVALPHWSWPTPTEWMWLIGLGISASLNMYGISRALQIGDATLAVPFDFLRLPFTTVFAVAAFGEPFDLLTWVGAAIVLGSAVYIARRDALSQSGAEQRRSPATPDT
jgi:drug/metabolite transporter (DMT)-like permease